MRVRASFLVVCRRTRAYASLSQGVDESGLAVVAEGGRLRGAALRVADALPEAERRAEGVGGRT